MRVLPSVNRSSWDLTWSRSIANQEGGRTRTQNYLARILFLSGCKRIIGHVLFECLTGE